MQSPTWLKPGIMGVIVGGIATMVLGFNFGGWYLGSSAQTMANKQSNAAVIEALVPVCIGKSQTDPDAAAKLATFSALKASYDQRDFVMKSGWATTSADASPNQGVASACADLLSKTAHS